MHAAGYAVQVVGSHWAPWADALDPRLLATRGWSYRRVGGAPQHERARYLATRLRHGLSRRLLERLPNHALLARWALCRTGPELAQAALRARADLYIAHNLGALPAAVGAGERYGVPVGFDAEDIHTGQRLFGTPPTALDHVTERVERQLLPRCAYVSAATPGVATAYAGRYNIAPPTTILNVFPLEQRPPAPPQPNHSAPLRLYWFSQTIGPERGLEDVVAALGLLGGCAIELHLRGQWSAGYREQLVGLAVAAGVQPERIQSHSPGPSDEMARLAASYDVGLAVEPGGSQNSGVILSNKFFTYLLAGNAVAATATSEQQALMAQLVGVGFTYAPGDTAALANGLRGWYDDRAALQAAREAAWGWGTTRYNWDNEQHLLLRCVGEALGHATKRL